MDKYLNLVTSQHKTKPNFMAWVAVNIGIIDDSTSAIENIISAFDIDNAVGVNLDTIGQILGLNRIVNFQPSDGSSPSLSDDMYRVLLKFKIIKNQWDGTIVSLQNLWSSIFPGYYLIVKDNKNMTANIMVIGASTTLEQQLINNGYIVPRPMGVKYNYSFSANPVFAYDLSNSSAFGGYDNGYWLQNI